MSKKKLITQTSIFMFPHGYLCQLVFKELYISLSLIFFFAKRLTGYRKLKPLPASWNGTGRLSAIVVQRSYI